MKKLTMILAATALAFPAAAGAQSQMRGPQGDVSLSQMQQRSAERFAALDANNDGRVTKAEMEAQREARRDARFDRLDTNDDGAISKAEMDAAREQRAAKRTERMANREGDAAKVRGKRGNRMGKGMRGGGFDRLDANNDGSVTLAEFQAPQIERFQRADANGDGVLTQAERQSARQAMRDQRRANRANR